MPYGYELYQYESGNNSMPVLLKQDVIAAGDNLDRADAGLDQAGQASVNIRLSGEAGDDMLEHTRGNVGKSMAVLFVETTFLPKGSDTSHCRDSSVNSDGKIRCITKKIINLATIQGVFGNEFQITGLGSNKEATQLAFKLRAGALAAPMDFIEERTIGPSLGQDNIEKGWNSIMIGLLAVVVFMALYYNLFGVFSNVALVLNLVLLVAVMGTLSATLTLPGMAGILLTLGMAVDANVLIYERIREELRNGLGIQQAISAGFDRAFLSIADANVTTLIAGGALYIFGTGPIKGFAVTLCIGIFTSMFTAVVGTRAIVNAIYGNRSVKKLSI